MAVAGPAGRARVLRRAAFGLAVALLAVLAGPEPSRAATFTVTNLNDAGAGSLRQAILDANATANVGGVPDRIEFAVAGVITLTAALDPVQESVVIDGTTSAGVMVSGAGNDCFIIAADDVTVTGLTVGGCNRGLLVSGARATISDNEIGVDLTGNAAAANMIGIQFDSAAADAVVTGNVVSANPSRGILVASDGIDITGNIIGLGRDGTTDLGNLFGIEFTAEATGAQVGGTTAAARNVISANGGSDEGAGIRVLGDGTTVAGDVIQGNYIGTDQAGTAARGNFIGVEVQDNSVTIGGGAANVISGNTGDGVRARCCMPVTITGNLIGLAAGGATALGNQGDGIDLQGAGHTVGGAAAGAGNVISANGGDGVLGLFAGPAVVEGNIVGADVTGTVALGNVNAGVAFSFSDDVTIGGTAGNVIVDNSVGIMVDNASRAAVVGNRVGTNPAGDQNLGNVLGIGLYTVTDSDVTGNVVVSSQTTGIEIQGSDVRVHGDFVGTDEAIDPNLGNANGLVVLDGSSLIEIGVGVAGGGLPNRIFGNTGNGVTVLGGPLGDPTGVSILGNMISNNGGLGIDLGGDGVTPNDVEDSDTGPNELQNYPVLTSITAGAPGTADISGTLNTTPGAAILIEFFANVTSDNEGEVSVGTISVSADGGGNASFTANVVVPPGGFSYFTATATNSAPSTSEFSSVVILAQPTVVSTVASGPVTIGGPVTDTVTVTGNGIPSGSVVFRLYGPADPTCAGPPVYTSVAIALDASGSATSSPAFTPAAPGTYLWIADYGGDAENTATTGACGDPGESVVVGQATPAVSTVASPGVVVGGTVTDTATLAGGFSPTGTITFRLYGPGDATCAGPAVFTDFKPAGAGAVTSAAFTPTAPGTYRWIASYGGDTNNAAVSGACNDANESVAVGQATPTLSTVASAGVPVGGTVTDTATLAGGVSPTGTITFRLYGPGDATCAGPAVFTDSKPAGAGPITSAAFTPTAPGTYRWIASYSGDPNNAAVAGACNDANESVAVGQATPTISTVASAGVPVGGTVSDTVTLAGGVGPTGTITFRLYGPGDATCAGPAVFTDTQPAGAGPISSAAFTPTAPGTYRWIASYSGDTNNAAVAGACNDPNESVAVGQATPTLSTVASAGVPVGGTVTDAATMAGAFNPTGTITFRLYGPGDTTCAAAPVFTDSKPAGAGPVTSAAFTPTTPGTYRWIASYGGDTNNAPVAGACNDANESVVVSQAAPTISTVASAGIPVGGTVTDAATMAGAFNPTGTITFRLYGPGDTTCAAAPVFTDSKPAGAGPITSAAFTPTIPGTYRWIASYGGDTNNAAVSGACNDPNESVVVGQAAPTISTVASAGVPVGGTVTDTATLAGAFNPTGTITFRLYGPNDATCVGPPALTNTQPAAAGPITSAAYAPTAPGTYRWIASYGGDSNNAAASGACNDANESVAVGQATPTISTVASAGVPVGGTVTDAATLAGAFNPTGTIAFRLYGPGDATCASAPVFTDTQPAGAGPITSGAFTPTAPGTYRWIASYGGDTNNAAVAGACNDANESVAVGQATPSISTVASAGVPVGGTVTDTATLAGAFNPTGTITFRLYGPGDTTCAAAPVFTDSKPAGAGPITSATFAPTSPGTYRWIASYGGDTNNAAVAGACNDANESVAVGQATPTISTVASAGVPVGGTVTDAATLAGAFNPTGTITFRLYGPGDTTCAAAPVFTDSKPAGAGPITSAAFTPTTPGTYRWIASYGGDTNNAAASGACNDANESVAVGQATPTISTVASAGVPVGGTVTDAATLAGGFSPTGTISFRLYGPGDATCAGPAVFTNTQPASAGPITSGAFTPTAPGTYRWIASYGGDSNNGGVSGACNDANESVAVGQATPTISTVASSGVPVGGTVTDSATLAGAFNPTGAITFRLYGPGDATCAGPPAFTDTRPAAAGPITSAAYAPTAPGTYRWIASYGGDINNAAASGACNDANESVAVGQAAPSISTVASAGVPVGGTVTDTATLAGAFNPTGTITFRLYGPGDATCAGPAVFTNTQPAGAGPISSAAFTPTAPGTYRWIASYSGDANNAAVAGACNDANESVAIGRATPSISTVASAGVPVGGTVTDTATLTGAVSPTGTITFRLHGPGDATCVAAPVFADSKPAAAGPITSAAFIPTAPGTYRWIASYSGDTNNAPVAGACNDVNESVAVGQATPTISTVASPNVPVGGTVTDTATLTGAVSPTGTITFRLYGPNDATCAGPAVFTNTQPAGAGPITSAAFTPTSPGTYRWIASYSGDTNNAPVAGACNDANESVVVSQAAPTISTVASAGVPVGGTVTDAATLTGAFNPTGTITFRLYGPNDATCARPPAFTNAQPAGAGPITSAAFTPTAPGTYRWVASYTGDANNAAAAGACNDPNESVVVGPIVPSTTTSTSTSTSTTTTIRTTTTTEPPDNTPPPAEETTTTTGPTTTVTAPTTTSQSTTTVPPPTTSTAPPTPPVGTTVPNPAAPEAAAVTTTPASTTPASTAPLATPASTTAVTTPTSAATATSTPATTPSPATSASPTPTSALAAPSPPPTSPPPPAATVEALSPTGARTGPPGVGLEIAGAGYSDCRFVYVFFDGQRIATVRPDAAGAIDGNGFSVPGDASPGSHNVTSSCQSSGKSVRATTTFMVTARAVHRSAFVTALPQPHQVSLALGDLATSAIAALLILLLFAFPYELFNSTVEENYDEIRGWFRLPARAAAAATRAKARTVAFFVFNVIAAAVFSFVSPDFGLNWSSLFLWLGMFVGLLIMAVLFSAPAAIAIHRRYGEWGQLNFLPGSLGISIAMVVMSRLLHFQPGYVYGAMAGLAFRSALGKGSQGRLTAANWVFSLVISVGAWFARVPVSEAAAQPHASAWWMAAEVCLAIVFLWGVESLAVAMLPMRFLDGRKVIDWNRPVWAVLMFAGAFVTVHVLLSANSGYVGQTGAQVRWAVVGLFCAFGAFSVAVWGYFRYRPQRPAVPSG